MRRPGETSGVTACPASAPGLCKVIAGEGQLYLCRKKAAGIKNAGRCGPSGVMFRIRPMNHLHFEWDKRKSTTNKAKHGVSFEEARTVFYDEYARLIDDPDIPKARTGLSC